jgi:hypothetical protein
MIHTSNRFADLPTELHYKTALEEFPAECERLMVSRGAHLVCEVGAGRSPLLEIGDVTRLGLDYTIIDVSATELLQAPPGYKTLCLDICSDLGNDLGERFDFVFSKMVVEHVRSGEAMHRNVYAMLKPGGTAFHFFPTLFHPAFTANYLIPEIVSRPLVRRFRPHHIKFRGATRNALAQHGACATFWSASAMKSSVTGPFTVPDTSETCHCLG